MMPVEPLPSPLSVPRTLPPPRSTMPTLEFALDDYARQSCLPDADDDLVFEPAPLLGAVSGRVPYRVVWPDAELGCSRDEALMLALVDGVSPVALLVQLVDIGSDTALVTLCDLFARGFIQFY